MAVNDLLKTFGIPSPTETLDLTPQFQTSPETGTLGLEQPSTLTRVGSRLSNNLIRMGGYDPMQLSGEQQRKQARLAGLQELSYRLSQTAAKLSGDPRRMQIAQQQEAQRIEARTPKDPTAKQGSLWKDQESGQTFREIMIGNKLFFQSPNTGESLSLEEMRQLYPEVRPTTSGEPAKYYADFKEFRKESDNLLTSSQSIDRLNEYLNNLQKTPIGIERLYNRFTTALKTIAGDSKLTEQEVALKIAAGNLQGLVGSNRLEIAGPGVLTEQDWQRILDALGGDVTLLQNPTIVFPLINDILSKKIERYNQQTEFYNAAVQSGNFGKFKEKELKKFVDRSYLPEGIPEGSRLLGVQGDNLFYITPSGETLQFTQE